VLRASLKELRSYLFIYSRETERGRIRLPRIIRLFFSALRFTSRRRVFIRAIRRSDYSLAERCPFRPVTLFRLLCRSDEAGNACTSPLHPLVAIMKQTTSKYDGPPRTRVNFTLSSAVRLQVRISSNRAGYRAVRAPCMSALAAFTSSLSICVHMHFTSMEQRMHATRPVAANGFKSPG